MSILSALFPQAGLIAAVALIGTAVVGSGYVVHKFDEVRYNDLVASTSKAEAQAAALAAAKQENLDAITIKDGAAESAVQAQLATVAASIKAEIRTHVTPHQDQVASASGASSGCVSYGVVRVLDAAVHGVNPSTLQPPAGQSDDACAPVSPSALASGVVANYAAAQANAEQLNALEADIKAKDPNLK